MDPNTFETSALGEDDESAVYVSRRFDISLTLSASAQKDYNKALKQGFDETRPHKLVT